MSGRQRPVTKPCTPRELIFAKGAKNTQWGKLDSHMQKNEIRLYLQPLIKATLKWIKNLTCEMGNHTTLRRKQRAKAS